MLIQIQREVMEHITSLRRMRRKRERHRTTWFIQGTHEGDPVRPEASHMAQAKGRVFSRTSK